MGTTASAVAVVLVLQSQVQHVKEHEARPTHDGENRRNDAVMVLLMHWPTVGEVFEVSNKHGDQSQNVEGRWNKRAVPLDPVPHRNRTDYDGGQHEEDVDPDVAEEAESQRAQEAQSDAGKNAVDRTQCACARSNPIPQLASAAAHILVDSIPIKHKPASKSWDFRIEHGMLIFGLRLRELEIEF